MSSVDDGGDGDVGDGGVVPPDGARLDILAGGAAFFARVFSAPLDPALRARLADPSTMAAWPAADPANVQARALITSGAGDAPADLAAEYQRLFIGPARLAAPPWESVYRTPERLVFGAATVAVRAAYAAAGYRAPLLGREPDDHVALEFDLVAKLAARAVTAHDDGDAATAATVARQVDGFLAGHLAQWVPQWGRLLADDARADFYRGAALLAVDLVTRMG